MAMSKADFAAAVAEKLGVTKTKGAEAVDAVLEVLTESLAAGEKIQFVGFGSFEIRDRAEREVRVPSTGEKKIAAASKAVAFKAGKALKDAVNTND